MFCQSGLPTWKNELELVLLVGSPTWKTIFFTSKSKKSFFVLEKHAKTIPELGLTPPDLPKLPQTSPGEQGVNREGNRIKKGKKGREGQRQEVATEVPLEVLEKNATGGEEG